MGHKGKTLVLLIITPFRTFRLRFRVVLVEGSLPTVVPDAANMNVPG